MEIELRSEKIFLQIVYLYINALMLTDIIRKLCFVVGFNQILVKVVQFLIYFLCLFLVLFHSYRTKRVKYIFLLIYLYSVACFFSLFINSEIIEVLFQGSITFLLRCIPAFYIGFTYKFEDKDIRINDCYFSLVVFYCLLTYYLNKFLSYEDVGGYMTFSYNILLQTEIMLFFTLKKPRFLRFFFIGIVIVFMFAMGARGPIACLIISSFVFLLFYLRKISVKEKIVLYSTLSVMILLVLFFRDSIIRVLNEKFSSSRTIGLLLKGDLKNLSGREEFYEKTISGIGNFPTGLYADRVLLGKAFGSTSDIGGYYVHNIFYEILYQWGILIGFVICFMLLLYITVCFFRVKRWKNNLDILYATFFSGFIMLIISSSYLINEKFWLFLGLLFCVGRYRKNVLANNLNMEKRE